MSQHFRNSGCSILCFDTFDDQIFVMCNKTRYDMFVSISAYALFLSIFLGGIVRLDDSGRLVFIWS